MANITLFIPDSIKKRMVQHKDVKWSNAVRTIIESKLDKLEKVERLIAGTKFTEKDAEELASKVNKGMGRHARELLNEISG